MSEQDVDLSEMFGGGFSDVPLEGDEGAFESPDEAPAGGAGAADDFKVDPGSAEVDKQIKEALTRALDNSELPCILVDLLSPGLAITRMRGDMLEPLPPWQHLAVAMIAIGGCAVATNPRLREAISMRKKVGGRPHKAMAQGPPAGYGEAPTDYDNIPEDHDPVAAFSDPPTDLEATGDLL